MSDQFFDSLKERSSRYFSTENDRCARLSEMYRRLKTLQAKRVQIRNELEAIEKYLVSLDSQIKSYEHYHAIDLNI